MVNSTQIISDERVLNGRGIWAKVADRERAIVARHLSLLPVSVGALAKDLGVKVRASTLPAGTSGEIRPDPENRDSYLIRVSRHEVKHRQRFTVAHEIAHYLLHRDLIENGIVDNVLYRSKLSNAIEAEANRLAAEIIMPTTALKHWLSQVFPNGVTKSDVKYIAKFLKVSEQAASIRLGV